MAEEPRPGLIVGGRYELLEVAGRGGMADVWHGRVRGDSGFVRDVAIKQMHANLAIQPQYVAMFVEEARVGSLLQSPNISEVHDFVHDRGHYYMVLEWIEGVDLGSWIKWHVARGEPTRWELIAAVAVGVLRGLAAAHERVGPDGTQLPIVHRDVSPHNVLLTTRGIVKLIDFGLAFAPDRPQETTEPGIVKGKMSYLAPEIVNGGRPTPASDQFACGSLLWEALVGRKLFDGETDYEVYCRLRDCLVQPLRPLRPDVPPAFAQIIQRALASDADGRFPSTREMARQIGTALKKVQLRKDLHTVLSRSVFEARSAVDLTGRDGETSDVTPLAELLPEETPRLEPPRIGEGAAAQALERLRGLRHYLPFFGKKRG
ncbi:MAG: serine/threonine protein kinase [Deltaproteobacteria bacterium]|nr:MAG: serine/threonine protein kinase [Deltaproteobacteria bacterium]TMQ25232.1 MAG: serine/threonine protein kinase [Deltaproteobacteria bacterium]